MKRALITGGAGFIGWHLARHLLADGFTVDLVDDFSRGCHDEAFSQLLEHPAARVHSIDLLKPTAFSDFDAFPTHIYHLAAKLGVANVQSNPASTLSDNLRLLEHTLAFARRAKKLERFTFLSTSEVYAGSASQEDFVIPTPESTRLVLAALDQPRTSYALSKISGEALCHYADLPITIVRPHNIYGPRMGNAHVIPQLLGRILDTPEPGKLAVYSPEHTRAFCYIDDAVEQIRTVAESAAGLGATFNVGNPKDEITMAELARLLLGVVGKNLEIEPRQTTPGSPERRCPDITRLLSKTRLSPPAIDLEIGLARTVDWYRTELEVGTLAATTS